MFFSSSLKAYVCLSFIIVSHLLAVSGVNLSSSGTAGCTIVHPVDGVSRNFSVSTDGGSRTYRLHLPSSYNPNTPAPLVISFHGHGKNMVEQETLSQFSNDAINPDMIAVYPQGLKGKVSRYKLLFLRGSCTTICFGRQL